MSTNEPMTQEQLDAIRGRLDARTPGEWEASGRGIDALAPSWGEVVSTEVNCMNYCYGGTGRGVERTEDAELIANAPQDLADLLAEVERLSQRNEDLEYVAAQARKAVERLRALTTVDDAMIERGVRAFYEHPTPGVDASLRPNWDRIVAASPDVADKYRRHMADALDAVLGTGEGA